MVTMPTGVTPKHPIQPLEHDAQGVLRFKTNPIVRKLLELAELQGYNLNEIAAGAAAGEFTRDDMLQFWQLIGYSLGGYGDLSFVDDGTYMAAAAMASGLTEEQARIQTLTAELAELRKALRGPIARLFGLHPDDLGDNHGH